MPTHRCCQTGLVRQLLRIGAPSEAAAVSKSAHASMNGAGTSQGRGPMAVAPPDRLLDDPHLPAGVAPDTTLWGVVPADSAGHTDLETPTLELLEEDQA